jgi:hypothetical protein
MTTFAQTIDEVLANLRGYVRDQELSTHLTSGINSTATSMVVNDATVLSRGRAEIGSELVWIDSVNRTTNTATIAPYGRGMDGTTAAAHSTNDRVIYQPLFPRYAVARAINDTLRSVTGTLFGVASTTLTANAAYTTYALPSNTEGVYEVTWQIVGPTREWQGIRRWKFNSNPNTTTWPTGKTIDIFEDVTPGRTINVSYRKQVGIMSSESDVYTTATGLQERTRDCIALGATYRLLSAVDMGLIATRAIEANTMDSKIAPGAGQTAARFMFQLFQARLAEERAWLLDEYPAQTHYTR